MSLYKERAKLRFKRKQVEQGIKQLEDEVIEYRGDSKLFHDIGQLGNSQAMKEIADRKQHELNKLRSIEAELWQDYINVVRKINIHG